MKVQEIRGKSIEDMSELIDDCKEELFKLRFAAVTEQVENSSRIQSLRKTIARVHTVLRERQIAAPAAE